MIQLTPLNGKTAGTPVVARRFPFVVGRDRAAGLRLEEPGVWERHLELTVSVSEGVVLQSHPAALTLLNGQPIQKARLRSGDLIEAGPARLRFDLGPTRQRGLRLREGLLWLGLATLAGAQFLLIYRFLP
jgi:pSer/pThr/pTyr-binding forkhead associated (FHA) protein